MLDRMVTPVVKRRELDWKDDDDGDKVALNPYPGDPDSTDYATRYIIRRERGGYTVYGEYGHGEDALGTFADIEEAKAAAQRDADERAGAA
jgi:hypothetical protein